MVRGKERRPEYQHRTILLTLAYLSVGDNTSTAPFGYPPTLHLACDPEKPLEESTAYVAQVAPEDVPQPLELVSMRTSTREWTEFIARSDIFPRPFFLFVLNCHVDSNYLDSRINSHIFRNQLPYWSLNQPFGPGNGSTYIRDDKPFISVVIETVARSCDLVFPGLAVLMWTPEALCLGQQLVLHTSDSKDGVPSFTNIARAAVYGFHAIERSWVELLLLCHTGSGQYFTRLAVPVSHIAFPQRIKEEHQRVRDSLADNLSCIIAVWPPQLHRAVPRL